MQWLRDLPATFPGEEIPPGMPYVRDSHSLSMGAGDCLLGRGEGNVHRREHEAGRYASSFSLTVYLSSHTIAVYLCHEE